MNINYIIIFPLAFMHLITKEQKPEMQNKPQRHNTCKQQQHYSNACPIKYKKINKRVIGTIINIFSSFMIIKQ